MVAIVAGVSYGFGGRKVAIVSIVAIVAGVGEGVKLLPVFNRQLCQRG